MIAYLKGELVVKSEEYIIIEVQGIGYKVFMSKKSIDELQENRQVRVYTYLKVREDDISLFGFNTNEELHMFELLISVGGIGAKSAITILSNITPSRFALAVIRRCHKKINIEDIEINLESRSVKKCGKKVKLTPKEFDLFIYLYENQNKALKREKIYERVWGDEELQI